MSYQRGVRPDYTVGTITLIAGDVNFTTTGASLESAVIQGGDTIMTADGRSLIIDEITGQNAGTLIYPCPTGADGTDLPVRIRYQPDGSRFQGAARDLVVKLGSGNIDAIAGLQGYAGAIIKFTGVGTVELVDIADIQMSDPHHNLAQLASLAKANNQFVIMGDDGSVQLMAISDITDAIAMNESAIEANTNAIGIKKLSSFSNENPIYIAHRNQAQLYPDQSLGAFRMSAASPYVDALELDCRVLSDGGVVAFHDATVDRVTTSTGNVESLTTSQFKALLIDGEVWQGANVADGGETVTVDEVLKEFKGKKLFMPEIKSTGKAEEIVSVFISNKVPFDCAVFSSFTLSDLAPAQAAGYQTMLTTSTATPSEISSAIAAGVDWVAINKNMSNADVTAWVASGLKVVCWTVNRRFDRDRLLSLGVIGFYSDDVEYLARDKAKNTSSCFQCGKWEPGMLAASDRLTQVWRGRIFPNGYWGWGDKHDDTLITRQFVLQGWASNLPNGDMSITSRIKFIDSDNNSRWASLAITETDREMLDDVTVDTWTNGYNLLAYQNGNLAIYKIVNGVATSLTPTGVPSDDRISISNGSECVVRVKFSGSTITLYRLSEAGNILYSVTASDQSYRGGYLHLGRRHVAAVFSDITIMSGNAVPSVIAQNVVSSGSNANGDFVRFSDGTQICWGIVTIVPIADTSTPAEFPWPASFLSLPTITANAYGASLAIQRVTVGGSAMIGIVSLVRTNTTSTNVSWMAIGRWK